MDADTGFDKYTIRHKINRLLTELWGLPMLSEPKDSILAMLPDGGGGGGGGGDGGSAAAGSGGGEGWSVFSEFVVAILDTVAYNLQASAAPPPPQRYLWYAHTIPLVRALYSRSTTCTVPALIGLCRAHATRCLGGGAAQGAGPYPHTEPTRPGPLHRPVLPGAGE